MGKLRSFMDRLHIVTAEGQDRLLGDVISWPQMDMINRIEDDLEASRPSRYIVLKARQIGISTIVEGLQFAGAVSKINFKGRVVAQDNDNSQHLLGMTRYYNQTFWGKTAVPLRYDSRGEMAWQHLNSSIKISTAKNTSSGRGGTYHFLHASEVAFWEKGEELMTGLAQAVHPKPQTFVFLESTANGVGGYFYNQWEAACNKDSMTRYVPLFYPYWAHPTYLACHIGLGHLAEGVFVPADDEERLLLRYLSKPRKLVGVTYPAMDLAEIQQRLVWRRYTLGDSCQGDLNKLHQEYPSTPEEAFIATGTNVFDLAKLKKIYEPIEGDRGRLVDDGGKVRFIRDESGPLEIYRYPSDRREFGFYMVGGDGKKAVASASGSPGDYACAQIVNRKTWEQVARWRGRLDQNAFGEEMIRLGRFYNNAMLAPETGIGGPGVAAHIIARGYPHIYQHRKSSKMPGQVDNTWGWITNMQTKQEAIGNLQSALHDATDPQGPGGGIRIHDPVTYAEMRNYVVLPDGGYGNADGAKDHDDTVMALAIALTCARHEASAMAEDARYEAPRYHSSSYKSNLNVDEVDQFESHLGQLGVEESPTISPDGQFFEGRGDDVPWLEERDVDYYYQD